MGDTGVSRICASTGGESLQAAPTSRNRLSLLSFVCSAASAMSSLSHSKQQMESFNQIQYVSRAFHTETFGLEFRYNIIEFGDSGRLSAAQRCRIFVNEVKGRSYANDLKLCVMGSHPSLQRKSKSQALTLLEYCALYPKATIRWHNPHWSLKDPKFILIGLAYTTALRGDREIVGRLMHSLNPSLKFDLSGVSLTLPNKIPSNYRILPAEQHFSRAILMEAYQRSVTLDGTDIMQWIGLVEGWFKEGV
jgi:hypothetical protein